MVNLIKVWGLPIFFSCVLVLVALLSSQQALQFYEFLFAPFPVDPQWVGKHSTVISNYGHVIGFALLAVICMVRTRLRFWQVAAFCVTLASAIELAQFLTPDRQGRLDDLGLGVAGVMLGLSCSKLICLKSSGSLSNADKNG